MKMSKVEIVSLTTKLYQKKKKNNNNKGFGQGT